MYYLKKSGKILGPFALDKLQSMVANGKLAPADAISEDRANWIEAAKIKELFPDFSAAAPAVSRPLPVSAPEVDLREELKVKRHDNSDSYVNQLKDPALEAAGVDEKKGTSSAGQDVKVNFISVFWNPVYALPAICGQNDKSKLNLINSLLVFLNVLFFLSAMLVSGLFAKNPVNIIKMIIISIVPLLSIIIFLLLLKKMFSSEELLKGQEIVLVSGISILPSFLVLLMVALINLGSFFSSAQIIALLSGLGIYAVTFSVIFLFNASTRIFGIRGSGTVFVVSTLLLITAGITGFLIKLLL